MDPEARRATDRAVERVARQEWGRVLASLTATTGDLDVAEDSLQEAVIVALRTWPERGIPDHPSAWLLRTARRKAIDRYRRDLNLRTKLPALKALVELETASRQPELDREIPDERLSMIFTCCHPSLSRSAQVALTLRAIGGLSTPEIARAFLVPESTMSQRIVRAKRKIRSAAIPFREPGPDVWPERLESVAAVVYLIFNEGYSASSGSSPTREELCREAIRLGRMLHELLPAEPEIGGLLALMLLHDSRRAARRDERGDFVTLDEQDRTRWDRGSIEAGIRVLDEALARNQVGPFQIQAAISAMHTRALDHADTDWPAIVNLYRQLYRLHPSPVVRMNGIIAESFAGDPSDAVRELEQIEGREALESYQPYFAARADVLRRAGRWKDAEEAYRRALELTSNDAEAAFIRRRMEGLRSTTHGGIRQRER